MVTTTSIGGPAHPGADDAAEVETVGDDRAGASVAVGDRPGSSAVGATLHDQLSPPMPADGIWGWVWPIAIAVLAGVLRFWRLGDPPQIVFDETYYAKDAYSLLRHGYERKVVDVPEGGVPIDTQILDGRTDIFTNDPSYVVHPPVGKWMIAFGEWLFGLTPFGWRFGVALFGTLTVLVFARLARRLFRSTLLGSIAGLLLALDGLSIVMSRTALLDGPLTFWLVCAVACLLVDRDQGRARLATAVTAMRAAGTVRPGGPRLGVRWWRIAAGVCFGLAVGTKWSGLFVLAVCGVMVVLWDIQARKTAGVARPYSAGILYDGVPAFISTVVVAAGVYLVSWTGWFLADDSWYRRWSEENPAAGGLAALVPDALRSWWHYHVEAYGFHTGLVAEHPYAAHPIRWLFLARPTQFEFSSVDAETTELPAGVSGTPQQLCDAAKCARDVVAVGTPAIWWAACAALIVLLVLGIGRRDWRAGAILALVGATYLPWFQYGDRPIFYFYAVAIAPFMVLAVALVIGYALGPPGGDARRRRLVAVAVGAYLLLVLANTAYLYPVLTGEWIPYDGYSTRMWFRVWI